jgi:plastocyanin
MRTRSLRLVRIIGLALVLTSCGGKGSTSTTTPTTPTTPVTSQATISIPVGDGYGTTSFTPASVTIAAGGKVTWSNRDGQTHNSTSDSGLWSTDIGANGDITRTFSTKGTFAFHCGIHPGMTGSITVQ